MLFLLLAAAEQMGGPLVPYSSLQEGQLPLKAVALLQLTAVALFAVPPAVAAYPAFLPFYHRPQNALDVALLLKLQLWLANGSLVYLLVFQLPSSLSEPLAAYVRPTVLYLPRDDAL